MDRAELMLRLGRRFLSVTELSVHISMDPISRQRAHGQDIVNFREAMDTLQLSAADVANAFGLSVQTIRQMRLEEGHVNYRTPPENWRSVLAAVARKRGKELGKMADQIERER